MSHKITQSNQRGRYKTWSFASVLAPTHAINEHINRIATDNRDVTQQHHIFLVKACLREKVDTQERPDCVTFTTWRFSRADAALWRSNARDKIQLPDLPFEGYIQSEDSLDLPRLHRWMPDAIWKNVSGKLHRSPAYQQFNAANDVFEYCSDGSIAMPMGGRPRKAISALPPPFA